MPRSIFSFLVEVFLQLLFLSSVHDFLRWFDIMHVLCFVCYVGTFHLLENVPTSTYDKNCPNDPCINFHSFSTSEKASAQFLQDLMTRDVQNDVPKSMHLIKVFDRTLNWHVTSKFSKVCSKRVSSEFFVCRLAPFAAPISSRVISCRRLAPLPPQQVASGELCP